MTRELERSSDRERLELALQVAGLGEFEWDLARDRLVVSPRMASITGIAAGERTAKLGELLEQHLHPDDLAPFRATREAALQSGETFDARYRIVRPDDGRTIWVRMV